jgi:acetyl esterase/lipase
MIQRRGYRVPKRFAIMACLLLAACLSVAENELAAAEITFEDGIEYSNPDGQHLKLNLAQPKVATCERLPAVVCIHGGGFRAGDRTRWNGLCRQLAERGYVAITVDYRLAPKYQFPACVYDVKAAVRWLRTNGDRYHVDPEQIAALGDSAGGHLAQYLGVTGDVAEMEGIAAGTPHPSSRVACVVSYYGPCDFTLGYKATNFATQEFLIPFLGGDMAHEQHRYIVASPLYWVTPAAPPMLLLQGTKDPLVAFQQAVLLRDRLKAADVDVELVPIEGAGHGFGGQDFERAEQAANAFLDKHLKPGPRAGAANPAGATPRAASPLEQPVGVK